MNSEIRKSIYDTYSDKYKVSDAVLEKGNYILINSIDTDFFQYLNTDSDIRSIDIFLEIRSFSNTVQTINNIENYIINSLNKLFDNLKKNGIKVKTLNLNNIIENNDSFENYYSKVIKFNLIIEN